MADEKKPAPRKPPVDLTNLELSDEQIEEIRAEALKIVADERLAALKKQALAGALEELRGKEGLRTGDPVEDEIVNLTIRLGENADRLVINGRPYFHGQVYAVPRHMARSMMDIMWRTEINEHAITDKPLTSFYQKPRHTTLSPRRGAQNAPQLPSAGLPSGML